MFLFANIKDRYVTSENPESDQNGHDTSVTMGCYAWLHTIILSVL